MDGQRTSGCVVGCLSQRLCQVEGEARHGLPVEARNRRLRPECRHERQLHGTQAGLRLRSEIPNPQDTPIGLCEGLQEGVREGRRHVAHHHGHRPAAPEGWHLPVSQPCQDPGPLQALSVEVLQSLEHISPGGQGGLCSGGVHAVGHRHAVSPPIGPEQLLHSLATGAHGQGCDAKVPLTPGQIQETAKAVVLQPHGHLRPKDRAAINLRQSLQGLHAIAERHQPRETAHTYGALHDTHHLPIGTAEGQELGLRGLSILETRHVESAALPIKPKVLRT
mmetsp:Transcript_150365/g.262736  ORF Transcript_150365/g.262736 Transcript_150365/m.262736 type:complete len:278 (+) Transcript_150365:355-1188(+)